LFDFCSTGRYTENNVWFFLSTSTSFIYILIWFYFFIKTGIFAYSINLDLILTWAFFFLYVPPTFATFNRPHFLSPISFSRGECNAICAMCANLHKPHQKFYLQNFRAKFDFCQRTRGAPQNDGKVMGRCGIEMHDISTLLQLQLQSKYFSTDWLMNWALGPKNRVQLMISLPIVHTKKWSQLTTTHFSLIGQKSGAHYARLICYIFKNVPIFQLVSKREANISEVNLR